MCDSCDTCSARGLAVEDHITLTQATKIAPGRPSVNAMWRWCQRGVLARTGERVRLQHLRVGGKLFTTQVWLEQFLRRLTDADTAFFDAKNAAAERLPPRDSKYAPPSRRSRRPTGPESSPIRNSTDIDRELDEEGL